MNVSVDEARKALAIADEVRARTRKAIRLGGGAYFLVLWGAIWFVGFLGSQFMPGRQAGLLWVVLDILGFGGSIYLTTRLGRRVRDPESWKVGALWIALVGYGALWIWLAAPASSVQIGVLLVSFAMFGYVVMGLWLDLAFLWIGLLATALAVVAYLFFPQFLGLWMSLLGGGTLLGSGLYILRRWGP